MDIVGFDATQNEHIHQLKICTEHLKISMEYVLYMIKMCKALAKQTKTRTHCRKHPHVHTHTRIHLIY